MKSVFDMWLDYNQAITETHGDLITVYPLGDEPITGTYEELCSIAAEDVKEYLQCDADNFKEVIFEG